MTDEPRETFACPGCHSPTVRMRADQETCGADVCRQRLVRGTYVPTAEDLELVRRLAVPPVPVPTEDDRRRALALAQPRVPAFVGAPVPEASIPLGPGGDPAARLRALRARRTG